LTKDQLLKLEQTVSAEVLKRRRLGGYSADAEGILIIGEAVLVILRYINSQLDRGGRK
jgi:hypothetical protein